MLIHDAPAWRAHIRASAVLAAQLPRGHACQRIDAILCSIGGDPQQLELQHENFAVHGMIDNPQDARVLA
jgi:hypothetical protein